MIARKAQRNLRRMSRIAAVGATAVLVLSGCGPFAATTPAVPTAIPSSTPTVVPPTPTLTPSPRPTSTPVPTATPVPTPIPPPTPVATLNPSGEVGLGVYLPDVPFDGFETVGAFERLVQHPMQYVLWFQSWGDDDRAFMSETVRLAAERGWIPVITWEPWERNFVEPTAPQPAYSLLSIVAGAHDAYIRSWAAAAHTLDVPIIIRFAHEQSTEPGVQLWYPWQGDPAGYRGAFQHIVSLFRQEGATNVQFLWSAMWLDDWAADYYPGDDVVDWVGTTVLNHGTGADTEWARWRTFEELFDGQYQAALEWGKPIMITEVATAEQGGDKAAWLRDAFGALETDYPLVEAVLLLEVESDREWPVVNWSVASSAESLAVFRRIISDPYFR